MNKNILLETEKDDAENNILELGKKFAFLAMVGSQAPLFKSWFAFNDFQSLHLCERKFVKDTKIPALPKETMQLIAYYTREQSKPDNDAAVSQVMMGALAAMLLVGPIMLESVQKKEKKPEESKSGTCSLM